MNESPRWRVRLCGVSGYLDRAHGKPRAAGEEKTSSLEERIAQMTPQERRARLAELTIAGAAILGAGRVAGCD